jgi:hypothetical protein
MSTASEHRFKHGNRAARPYSELLAIASLVVLSGLSGNALALTVDEFTGGASQNLIDGTANGISVCSTVADASILGGDRDACACKTGNNLNVELAINTGVVAGLYSHSQNSGGTTGCTQAVWDGVDGDPEAVGDGLELDLSMCEQGPNGENTAFEIGVVFVDPGEGNVTPELVFEVYDDVGTPYTKTISLTQTPPGYSIELPFSDFAPFDFQTVISALRLRVEGPDPEQAASDVDLNFVRTCTPKTNGNGKKVPAAGLVGAGMLGLGLAAFGAVAGFRRRR